MLAGAEILFSHTLTGATSSLLISQPFQSGPVERTQHRRLVEAEPSEAEERVSKTS